MLQSIATVAATAVEWDQLGLSPIALDLGFFQIRWYSLAYIAGIALGWWYLTRLIAQPGAPMARRHADDFVFSATLGIILGGRLGYVLLYRPGYYLQNPLEILQLWDGGMSYHGGVVGVLVAIAWLCRHEKLSFLRVCDYIACCVPLGNLFGRLANFVNGELWGRQSDVPWAIRFPEFIAGVRVDGPPRHPSQLYQAGFEGVVLFAVLAWLFWRTRARYQPGKLVGVFALFYGVSRFAMEWFREPDTQLMWLADRTGLTMGQWLSLPMMAVGLYFILTAGSRRTRVEPVAGTESVA